jgi:hypothetical protein
MSAHSLLFTDCIELRIGNSLPGKAILREANGYQWINTALKKSVAFKPINVSAH